MVNEFFDKKLSCGCIKNEDMSNQELVEKLNKPIIRKFQRRKVHSPFIENISGADLVNMQLMSRFNKGIRFLLCVIDISN